VIPQPSRFNADPITFVITVAVELEGLTTVIWPDEIEWVEIQNKMPEEPNNLVPIIKYWPQNFTEMFRENILQLDGEQEALFPISGKSMRFTHKSWLVEILIY
jgi:hypothetical protein